MQPEADILIIGAGPAGSASAILLAQAGLRVTVVERDAFPRHKVCGECVGAGSMALLDALGIGLAFRRAAGPELRQVGFISNTQCLSANMPPCTDGSYAYGRAVGRDRLDAMLLERAQAAGAKVIQPAKVEAVHGRSGDFACVLAVGRSRQYGGRRVSRTLRAAVVVDAHGSWEAGPRFAMEPLQKPSRPRGSDLFAFKTTFLETQLQKGVLPVLAIEGGYGGVVVSNDGRTTIACCLRRDLLARCRAAAPSASAGPAVELFLRRALPHLDRILHGARREGAWLAVGPVRPGVRLNHHSSIFRVGNAAGETHPLIGEGIGMALQSAVLFTDALMQSFPVALGGVAHRAVQDRYCAAWTSAFVHRLHLSRAYARLAMHPLSTRWVGATLHRWPDLLTHSARWAGKAGPACIPFSNSMDTP